MRWLGLAVSALAVVVSLSPARAETTVIAVEDKDWSPCCTWVKGEPRDRCFEIAEGAFRHNGAEVEFVFYPRARVIQSVELRKVGSGFCGTRTDERAAYSQVPYEALLDYDATLFVRAEADLQRPVIEELRGKNFALVHGHNFGEADEDIEAVGMIRTETPCRESLVKLLLIGRVDTSLDCILPLLADARRLEISSQIRVLLPSLAETLGFLSFGKTPGHDALAKRFFATLNAFTETPESDGIKECDVVWRHKDCHRSEGDESSRRSHSDARQTSLCDV